MTHETMQRIFDATQKTPTEIADAINTKPQNINNWIKKSERYKSMEDEGYGYLMDIFN